MTATDATTVNEARKNVIGYIDTAVGACDRGLPFRVDAAHEAVDALIHAARLEGHVGACGRYNEHDYHNPATCGTGGYLCPAALAIKEGT